MSALSPRTVAEAGDGRTRPDRPAIANAAIAEPQVPVNRRPSLIRHLPLVPSLRRASPERTKAAAQVAAGAVLVAALAAMGAARAAVDPGSLLPVDQAFALRAEAAGPGKVTVRFAIADGYYLYRHRMGAEPQDAGLAVDAAGFLLPAGKQHRDEFFGDVETYRGSVAGTLSGTARAATTTLQVKFQGCADAGICYPPQVRSVRVALQPTDGGKAGGDAATGAGDRATQAPAGDGGFSALGRALGGGGTGGATPSALGAATDALPLPPERAFGFDAIAADAGTLLLRFTPAPGYYLYRDRTALRTGLPGVALGKPRWPPGKAHRDEHFGDVTVYFDQVEVPVPLRRAAGAPATTLPLVATFQGCQDDGICYPPMTRTVQVSLPAAPARAAAVPATTAGGEATAAEPPDAASPGASAGGDAISASAPAAGAAAPRATAAAPLAEDSRLAAALAGPGRWWTLLAFFGAGLLLAATPCVLPMVPILSGLIAGAGTRIGTARAALLSSVYVLSSALVFTAAGVVAGLLGANLQIAFQAPWVVGLFAALFVALALSSFGLFEIQLPRALRARLGAAGDRQRGGSLGGVAAMGALSALIVGPCVAPPLAGAVLYIGQAQDPVFGGLALFVLALGMGAPLVAFGIAAGRGMPTSGPWMVAAQRVFGFVFLALAAWMLSRLLPGPAALALYGLVAMGAAAWAFAGVARASGGLGIALRFAGLVLAVVGAAQLLGAAAGGNDPLKPLAGLRGGAAATTELPFRKIKSTADLDREIAAAQAAGQPLMLDFYADWCVACREMERDTFPVPAVHAALEGFVLLKADVTANDDADQALMRRLGIVGPPATLYYRDGAERRDLRLFGFEAADAFAARARRAATAPAPAPAPASAGGGH